MCEIISSGQNWLIQNPVLQTPTCVPAETHYKASVIAFVIANLLESQPVISGGRSRLARSRI